MYTQLLYAEFVLKICAPYSMYAILHRSMYSSICIETSLCVLYI